MTEYKCDSCGEVHPKSSMCPPHEVRRTGMAAIADLEPMPYDMPACEACVAKQQEIERLENRLATRDKHIDALKADNQRLEGELDAIKFSLRSARESALHVLSDASRSLKDERAAAWAENELEATDE